MRFAIDAPAAADGTTFTAVVTLLSGSRTGCTGIRFVQVTGAASASEQLVARTARNAGAEDGCTYLVGWPDSEPNGTTFRRAGSPSTRIDAAVSAQSTPTVTGTYTTDTVMMTPSVAFLLPPIDVDDDGDHDMSGERFRVEFTRQTAPSEDVNCTASAAAVYAIDDDGDVALVGPHTGGALADVTAGPFELVGWHADSPSACNYDVHYRANADFVVDESTGSDTDASWSSPTTAARFETARRGVDARLEAFGLGVPDGVSFSATLALVPGAHADCGHAEMVNGELAVPMTVTGGVGRATVADLTYRPAGWRTDDEWCDYTVTWEPDEDGAGALYPRIGRPSTSTRAAQDDERTNGGGLTYRAWYQRPVSFWSPNVSVAVPFDDGGGGVNQYAGETITVTYAPATRQAGCTANASDTFTIGAGAGALGGGDVTRGVVRQLVNEPLVTDEDATSVACTYAATAADQSTRPAAGEAGSLIRTSAAEITIEANGLGSAARPAIFAYVLPAPPPMPETTFTATLHLVAAPGVPQGTAFAVVVNPASGSDAGCSDPQPVAVVAPAADPARTGDRTSEREIALVDTPANVEVHCAYTVSWPTNETTANAVEYQLDSTYAQHSTMLSNASGQSTVATARYQPVNGPTEPPGDEPDDTPTGGQQPTVNQPADGTPTGGPQTGGGSRAPSTGGSRRPTSSGGGSRTPSSGGSGGGSGGASSGGAASTGPWVAAATNRVPVAVSVAIPQHDFPVGTAVEIMLNVPGTCGDDTTAFAGLPAKIGVVYALSAQSGATASLLAAGVLSLASYAQRGDETSDCELRLTLIAAPAGCTFSGGEIDAAGRSFVELSGGNDITSYAATPTLACG